MSEGLLDGYRIMIAEDEYLIAEDLRQALEDEGASVLGPAASVDAAVALIAAGSAIDAAVLDLNLGGEMSFPAADLLAEQGVPFLFTTGYELSALPPRFGQVKRCEKPFDYAEVARGLREISAQTRSA
jgi:DNA-binding response OmpR family regulator